MRGDLKEAARLAAATTEKVLERLQRAEEVVDAGNALMLSMMKNDPHAGERAIERLAEALKAYNKMRPS